MAFGQAFERRFVRQDVHENRPVEQTLETGWELLTAIPRAELKRIKDEFIAKYMDKYLQKAGKEKGKPGESDERPAVESKGGKPGESKKGPARGATGPVERAT
jgi:hypothetical protein